MVFERSIGSKIGKWSDAIKTVGAKDVKKNDAIVIIDVACGVNGSPEKFDVLSFADRKIGALMAGWILAQQTDEDQTVAIEEIKTMGVCKVVVLEGQTGSMMRGMVWTSCGW